MQFFKMILDSTTEFFQNIPNFLSYFFNIVNDTIDIIPQPFSQIIKVLLAIATVVTIVNTIHNLK